MKKQNLPGTLILAIGGLLSLGLVACQSTESLAGQASSDFLASAKSKLGDSSRVDSVDCSSLLPVALAKHGADDSLPESHDSLKARGCEDHPKIGDQDDDDSRHSSSQGETVKSHESESDSLEIETEDHSEGHDGEDHDGKGDDEKAETEVESHHSESGHDSQGHS